MGRPRVVKALNGPVDVNTSCSRKIRKVKSVAALEDLAASATIDIASISCALVAAQYLSFHRAASCGASGGCSR